MIAKFLILIILIILLVLVSLYIALYLIPNRNISKYEDYKYDNYKYDKAKHDKAKYDKSKYGKSKYGKYKIKKGGGATNNLYALTGEHITIFLREYNYDIIEKKIFIEI